jgi:hypothetical protein
VRAAFDAVAGVWTVQGDVDGDGNADFQILVTRSDANPIVVNDFVL